MVNGSNQVLGLKAGLLGAAAGIHPNHKQSGRVVLPLDGDAHANISVIHLFLIGFILAGRNIIAPPISQRANHGIGGGILHKGLIGLPDEPLQDQLLHFRELSGVGDGVAVKGQG